MPLKYGFREYFTFTQHDIGRILIPVKQAVGPDGDLRYVDA